MDRLLLLAVTALLGLTGCGTGPVEVDVDDPWIGGIITRVESHDQEYRVLIEENPNVDEPSREGGKKMMFWISDETVLLESSSSGMGPTGRSSIKRGRRAAAVTYGVVLESYPGKAGADTLIVYK